MILFKNRQQAGQELAKRLKNYKNNRDVIVLGIPRGGVAVGAVLAKKLYVKFDLIIPRKLPIPINPEMGFGAVLSDGTVLLNKDVIQAYNISRGEINQTIREVLEEVKRREKKYRVYLPKKQSKTEFSDVKNKIVILADDGLATGFTMLAAIKAVKKYNPKKIIIAVPVSPESSIRRVRPHVNEIICLHTESPRFSFAVASFYQDFHDFSDEEVANFLQKD